MIQTSNDELVSPREIQRSWAQHLRRLSEGEVDKLVLIRGAEMEFVVLNFETYAKLVEGDEQAE